MATLHVVYDPTDLLMTPSDLRKQSVYHTTLRFIGGLSPERAEILTARLARMLLEQIMPVPEGRYRIRVPHEQEATELPIYAVYDFGLTTWSLTTKPDHATRWVSIAGAEADKEHAPQRIKLFGYVEEIVA